MLAPTNYPDAKTLRADIEHALNLYSEDKKAEAEVYVQGSDSNGSKPTAWVWFKYLTEHDISALKAEGFKLVQAWSEKRKIKAMFTFNGPEA